MKKIIISNKIIFEFISISFAVFLGLFLNQVKEGIDNRDLAKQSINNIRTEFIENRIKVNNMILTQKKWLQDIENANNKDNEEHSQLDFEFTNSSCWEAAQLTQSIMYMDVNIVQKLSDTYKLQSFYEKILKEYVLKNMYQYENKLTKNNKLKNNKILLNSLIQIENKLVNAYTYSLDKLLVE